MKETGNNVERAVDWIFSHDMTEIEESDATAATAAPAAAAPEPGHPDGTKYKLVCYYS